MAVLRFLASLFLLIAVVALVSDWTRASLAGQPLALSAFSKHWSEIAPATLASTKAGIGKLAGPWLWDMVIGRLLAVPTVVLFGLMGLLAGYGGRRRRRVNVYIN